MAPGRICGRLEDIYESIVALNTLTEFSMHARTMCIATKKNNVLVNNGPLPLLHCSCTGQVEQFCTRRGDGMGPVIRAFGSGDPTCNLVEKIGRWDRAVERRDKMSR